MILSVTSKYTSHNNEGDDAVECDLIKEEATKSLSQDDSPVLMLSELADECSHIVTGTGRHGAGVELFTTSVFSEELVT